MPAPRTGPVTRRRVLTGAVGLAAGSSLSACAGMSTTQPRAAGPLTRLTNRQVTLRMGIIPGPTEAAWSQAIADDFHRLHPNITVKVSANSQIADMKTLITSAMSHDLPDILFSADILVQTESSKGLLLDLTPYMDAYGMKDADFLGKIMDLGRWNGRQYVVPRGNDQVVVAYNPELFKAAGVPEPAMGWHWDAFLAACRKLQRRDAKGTQLYAMGTNSTFTAYPVYIPFMRGWGGDIATADGSRTTLDSPKVVEGVRIMMDFFRRYSPAFHPPPTDPFLGGTAAMTLMVRPQVMGVLMNAQRTRWTTPFTPKFVNFPLFPTPKIGAGMAGWAGSINTRHPHETAAFLMYTISRRGQRLYAKTAGEVPIRTDLAADRSWQQVMNFAGPVDQRAFYGFGDAQSFPPGSIPLVSNAQMATAIGNGFDSIRLGSASVEGAMRLCNTTINDILVGLQ